MVQNLQPGSRKANVNDHFFLDFLGKKQFVFTKLFFHGWNNSERYFHGPNNMFTCQFCLRNNNWLLRYGLFEQIILSLTFLTFGILLIVWITEFLCIKTIIDLNLILLSTFSTLFWNCNRFCLKSHRFSENQQLSMSICCVKIGKQQLILTFWETQKHLYLNVKLRTAPQKNRVAPSNYCCQGLTHFQRFVF